MAGCFRYPVRPPFGPVASRGRGPEASPLAPYVSLHRKAAGESTHRDPYAEELPSLPSPLHGLHREEPREDPAAFAVQHRPGAGHARGGQRPALPGQRLRHRRADRLGSRAGRPDVPADLPAARHAQGRRARRDDRPAAQGRSPRRDQGGGPPHPARPQPPPGWPEVDERAQARGHRGRRDAAQVPRDGAVLPVGGPGLPQLLHLLLPLAAVRRPGRHEVRRQGGGPHDRLPQEAPRGEQRAVHRRRPDGHEDQGLPPLHRAAAAARARPHRQHPHRHQGDGLLARPLRHRRRRRRPDEAVRRGPQRRPQPVGHGPLQPPRRARHADGPGGHGARAQRRRGRALPGAADPSRQRRRRGLGQHVEARGHPRRDPVLHVRRARHRPARLLRGAAGRGLPDLHRRLPQGLGPGAHGARPVDVVHARQGAGRRHRRGPGPEGLRAQVHPGPQPGLGQPGVLRQVRRDRALARRPQAGLLRPLVVAGRARGHDQGGLDRRLVPGLAHRQARVRARPRDLRRADGPVLGA